MQLMIKSRWVILVTAISGLVFLIVHAYSLGFVSVCADEFAKTFIACQGLSEPSLWFQGIWMPPHLMLIGIASRLTGDPFLASRLISIVFGSILIVAVWGIGYQIGGNRGGMFAAILTASHPLVAILSATAMADICYVALCVMGLRFYLRFSSSPPDQTSSLGLFAACGCLTLACGFHYNAWIAVLLVVPFLLHDLHRLSSGLPVKVASLGLLGSVPVAWVLWNWIHTGEPLAFFSNHSEYSASFWAHNGWFPSTGAAIAAIYDSVRSYSPLLAILAVAGIGTMFTRGSFERRQAMLWTLLAGFVSALILLYARGGRPAAFEPRYFLLPSVLLILLVSSAFARLCQTGDRQVRTFALLLTVAAVVVNLALFQRAVSSIKQTPNHVIMAEAHDLSRVLHGLKAKNEPRMVLEIKAWNFLALPVLLGRIDAVATDREIDYADPIRPFDNPSMLMGPREAVLSELRGKNVGFIAAWSPAIQDHLAPWGLTCIGQIDSYKIYRIPGEGVQRVATNSTRSSPR